ncbi:hypothetical protein ACFE04_000058 [Oxalis oulophora]
MEDTSSIEWQKIDDNFSSSQQNNNNSSSSRVCSILKWGKNILVTGVVVSSAPIVLPPLVVISAFGLFCSIPYGFFLATHACTDKVMSMLLNYDDHDQHAIKGYEEQMEYDDFDLRKGEPMLEEGGEGQGVEVLMVNEDIHLGSEDVEEDFEDLVKEVDRFVEESEYAGSFGNHENEKYGKSLEEPENVRKEVEIEEPILEISVAGNEIGLDLEGKPLDIAMELSEISETKEDEELVRETKELIEQLRDESENQNVTEEDKLGKHKAGRRKKKSLKKSDEKLNVAEKVTTSNEMADSSKKKNVQSVAAINKPVAITSESKNVEEKLNVAEKLTTSNEMADSSKKKHAQSVAATHKPAAITNEPKNVGGIAKKYPKPAVAQKDQAENNLGKRENESTIISLDKDIDMASDKNKVLDNEKKIWEQIKALRTIVGYKATIEESIVEELKALYLFTGVEPPSSLMNPSDLAEINVKLQFLMSIVGVK